MIQMLATRDAVGPVDVVDVAKEVGAEVPVQPCLGRQVPAKTCLPSSQAIRARMAICSKPQ